MKIAVLMGGMSKEREISLKSGRAVAKALASKGYDVVEVDLNGPQAVLSLPALAVDAAFIALHGKYGEDGTVQGLLEWLKIPYTGPGVASSALCFDKLATKKFLSLHGVTSPAWAVFSKGDDFNSWIKSYKIGFPAIVKPNTEGSSIGLKKAANPSELREAIDVALKYDTVLVERFISGREITVGIHRGKALPIVEIVPHGGLYDYDAKYTKGRTEYIVPGRIPPMEAQKISSLSEKIYGVLGCDSAVRADFIIAADGPYFLEVNTVPGMTETSLLPKAAAHIGVGFEDLCVEIVKTARLKCSRE